MRRLILAGLLSCLASSSDQVLHAQAVQQGDSTRLARSEPRADSVPTVVRVTSRKLPFMPGDLLMMNCSNGGYASIFQVIPYTCARHTSGTLEKLEADSVSFVRNGRTIRLAARDVLKLEEFTGRSALRTAGSSVMGGLAGVVGAAMIGIGGGLSDDAFVTTAMLLGTGGAIIGAVRGGSTWREIPRSFELPPAQRR
jgi:hypothetical protein